VTAPVLAPLAAAAAGAGRLIAEVEGERWALPTPCGDWTVRHLVNHVVGGNRLTARVLRGDPLPPLDQLGRRATEDRLGEDPVAAYGSSVEDLLAALAAPGVLDRPHTLPVGTLPGVAVVHLRTVETLVHGWDLGRAVGRPLPVPDDLAHAELAFSADLLARLPEGRRPFAPSVPVPADAPALDRLVALLGRNPDS
jgi:uncharacterized protein (TIGR03086 family)